MLLYVLLIISALLFYIYCVKPLKYWSRKGVKCIPGWPIFGNFAGAIFQVTSFADLVKNLYRHYPNERYVGYTQIVTPVLMIRDLELLKEVTVKDFDHFSDHNTADIHDVEPMLCRSIFFLNGKRWKDMRVNLSPAFTTSKMRGMFQLMQDCGKQLTDHLDSALGDESVTYNIKDIMSRYTNDVIASCAFGVQTNSLEDRDNVFYKMGSELANVTGFRTLKFLLMMTEPLILKILKMSVFPPKLTSYFRQIILDNIDYREKTNLVRPDMIHLMNEAKKGSIHHDEENDDLVDTGFATVQESRLGRGSTDIELTNDDIAAQALIFFFAGYDGVSTVLCYICQELAMNEDVQQRLQGEIDDVLDSTQKPSYEAIVKMKYLDMVISETLRKWPPGAAVDRKCVKDYTIQPRFPGEQPLIIEKGTILAIPVIGIHRDEKYYANPDTFDPERFNDENKVHIKPYSYLPFSVGPRSCIANRFALMELKVLTFNLLSKFDLLVTNKTRIPIEYDPSDVNSRMKGGCWLGIKKR